MAERRAAILAIMIACTIRAEAFGQWCDTTVPTAYYRYSSISPVEAQIIADAAQAYRSSLADSWRQYSVSRSSAESFPRNAEVSYTPILLVPGSWKPKSSNQFTGLVNSTPSYKRRPRFDRVPLRRLYDRVDFAQPCPTKNLLGAMSHSRDCRKECVELFARLSRERVSRREAEGLLKELQAELTTIRLSLQARNANLSRLVERTQSGSGRRNSVPASSDLGHEIDQSDKELRAQLNSWRKIALNLQRAVDVSDDLIDDIWDEFELLEEQIDESQEDLLVQDYLSADERG
jgi:hypothetical protein